MKESKQGRKKEMKAESADRAERGLERGWQWQYVGVFISEAWLSSRGEWGFRTSDRNTPFPPAQEARALIETSLLITLSLQTLPRMQHFSCHCQSEKKRRRQKDRHQKTEAEKSKKVSEETNMKSWLILVSLLALNGVLLYTVTYYRLYTSLRTVISCTHYF